MSPDTIRRPLRAASRLIPALVLLLASAAEAQPDVVLVVPEGAPSAVVDALVIELQLNGYAPLLSRQPASALGAPTDFFVHSGAARSIVLDLDGRVVVADRDGPIVETSLGGHLSALHPRVTALVVTDLALRRRPPPVVHPVPRGPPVDASPATSETTMATAAGALASPSPTALSAQLEPPPEADQSAAMEEVAEAQENQDLQEPREPWPGWLRVLTEVGIGFAGSAALGVPAAITTDQAAGGWLYGFALAGPIGFSLGVWLGGVLAGG
ncbi:MAG: hypothetical protein JRH11_26810, partial [Deltaproteobacteria bacterium]|nr:hypothetical protein [Deltaproteobacteria bacterium]